MRILMILYEYSSWVCHGESEIYGRMLCGVCASGVGCPDVVYIHVGRAAGPVCEHPCSSVILFVFVCAGTGTCTNSGKHYSVSSNVG